MDHRSCIYKLFDIEKPRSKATSKKLVLKHTILYAHCIDLLMWSPTKLNFYFYNFSVIYYDFFKDSAKINKKGKNKTGLL